MNTIIDYQILSAENVNDLQIKVKTLMTEGWQPVGPATQINTRMSFGPNQPVFQTMVKWAA